MSIELGGNAPFIVFDGADLKQVVEHLMSNKFRGAGQTCVCANRIYVQREIADAFANQLAERATALRVGDGMNAETEIGPLIDCSSGTSAATPDQARPPKHPLAV